MSRTPLIAPSILASDFSRLGEEVEAVDRAGADFIHLDIMDGHFVPNITFGPGIIKSIRSRTKKPFDAHLMIAPADPYIQEIANAGADIITVHPEAGPHLHRTLQAIQQAGAKAGVALNPSTPLLTIEPVLDMLDIILIMTVNPGFGGQKLIDSQLKKIAHARSLIDETGRHILLEVDGGVNDATAPSVISAGADILVAGSAVFSGGSQDDYARNIAKLRNSAN